MTTDKQPKPRKITTKQEKFAQEYIANQGNGTQAALTVYDTTDPHTACAIATENLSKPVVVDAIESLRREIVQSALDIMRHNGSLNKAIASAELDLTDDDPKARDAARKFLAEMGDKEKKQTNITHDNRKVTLKYPK